MWFLHPKSARFSSSRCSASRPGGGPVCEVKQFPIGNGSKQRLPLLVRSKPSDQETSTIASALFQPQAFHRAIDIGEFANPFLHALGDRPACNILHRNRHHWPTFSPPTRRADRIDPNIFFVILYSRLCQSSFQLALNHA